jgi:hypothetical protein
VSVRGLSMYQVAYLCGLPMYQVAYVRGLAIDQGAYTLKNDIFGKEIQEK